MEENEKHLKEIASLKQAAVRSRKWADKNEATKIGYDPVKEHDRSVATRAYIGAKTKKMQSRVTHTVRTPDGTGNTGKRGSFAGYRAAGQLKTYAAVLS